MNNTENYTLPWIDFEWFMLATFTNFSWEQPLVLYGLLIVPVILVIRGIFNRMLYQKLPVSLPRKEIKKSSITYLRVVPEILMMLLIGLVIIALARPQRTNEKTDQWTEGIDIMLVVDISHSMQIEDFKPNRLQAAKKVALDFIDGRFEDRIGVVIFSGDAYSLSPLTTDYGLLKAHIDGINFEMIENQGTAIGSALAVATNRMRESASKSKVLILLSDGENTAGNIDPITAAELAVAYDIKIYTIAIGKEGKVPFGKDFFGRPHMVESSMDETTLREIAKIGSGEFYRVSDNKALESVFALIDKYEKAEIKENRYKETTDFYQIYLRWAILLLLLWLALKSTFVSNILQD